MKKYRKMLKIVILTSFICLLFSSQAFAETTTKTYKGHATDDEMLNEIQSDLKKLGYKGDAKQSISDAEVIISHDGSSRMKEWTSEQWEYDGKKYTANAVWVFGAIDGKFVSEVTVNIDIIGNTPTEGDKPSEGTSNSNKYDYTGTSFEDLNAQIQKNLNLKGCTTNVDYAYRQYARTTTNDKETIKKFTIQWENSKYKYEAVIEEYEVFADSKFYANVDIKQEEKPEEIITTDPKPSEPMIGNPSAGTSHTVDEIIGEGNSFIDSGKSQPSKIDNANLKKASDTLYNILLSLGIVIAVAVGVYLGAKFMMASTGEKAQVKESLVPYIAGCVVVFGAFIIWKLAIMLFGQIG